MARRTAWKKARPEREEEILGVCLRQRREDTFGRPLETFGIEELRAMPAAQFARVKADGMLPRLILPHGPKRIDKDGIHWCHCEDCEKTRADWRLRTGRK
jgi:hypothetical protein